MDQHFLFYVSPDDVVQNKVRFPGDEAHHISKVLRKRPGDVIQVTDGCGIRMDVRLDMVAEKKISGEVIGREEVPSGPERILAMGVIRQRARLEFAIEKAVELGATRIVLVHSDHAEQVSVKDSRIDKTIVSAMKQSRRCHLPVWEERDSFYDVLAAYREHRRVIMAHPAGLDRTKYMATRTTDFPTADTEPKPADAKQLSDDTKPLSAAPRSIPVNAEPQLLMVGPEGGFSDAEIEQAVGSGAELVSLGPARLRAETAICAFLTLAR